MAEELATRSADKSNPISADAPSFGDMLTKLIEEVDDKQKIADESIKQLATGEETSIQDVVMKLEEADMTFRLMKEIRDKLVAAYKEVMSMSS
ncbi:flagellar hook-basal body complex protein FliE [bacterium F16]|nr:flagellar hook-basal body complex protein FliE [bacterium F16]